MLRGEHPTREVLEGLLMGELAEPEAGRVMAHLASGCEVCRPFLREVLGPVGTEERAAGYAAALFRSEVRSRAGVAAARADQLEAAALWATVEGTPPAQRWRLVTEEARFASWALGERLLAEARRCGWQDGPGAMAACRLAVAIAERLPAAAYPGGLAEDLRGRALGALAEALRVEGRLEEAAAALGAAWEAVGAGTGDPLERAGLLRVAANLALARGESGTAAALLRRAVVVYRRCGEGHLEGRALRRLALAVGHEDPAEGARLAERAVALVGAGPEPRTELLARHALIWFLNDCGMGWRALEELEQSRGLYAQCGECEATLMLPWLEARICRGLGQLEAAERGLAAVWHDFWEAGFPQELTLVTLDLAEVYLAQGKRRHAVRLLRVFGGMLREWRADGEAVGAWAGLVEAVREEGEAGDGAAGAEGAAEGRAVAMAREVGWLVRRGGWKGR
jgi:hypothetical protein